MDTFVLQETLQESHQTNDIKGGNWNRYQTPFTDSLVSPRLKDYPPKRIIEPPRTTSAADLAKTPQKSHHTKDVKDRVAPERWPRRSMDAIVLQETPQESQLTKDVKDGVGTVPERWPKPSKDSLVLTVKTPQESNHTKDVKDNVGHRDSSRMLAKANHGLICSHRQDSTRESPHGNCKG